jgi:GTP-binding protein
MNLPLVAIVGRPNVGKSSLFNRLLRQRLAVVDAVPGVTRDRNYAVCEWNGLTFRLVDTGGIVPDSRDHMERLIADQVAFAVEEADLVLFVVDTHLGVDPTERQIASRIHQSKRPHLLVANKVDNETLASEVFEFMSLGLGDPVPVSAATGYGTGDLLDLTVEKLPRPEDDAEFEEGRIRVAVVGKPNVGKSSFINKLLGQERLIVSPAAGTTRDAVDSPVEIEGREHKYVFIDTAGLRKRYKVHEAIEFFTTLRTDRAIERCDIAVVIGDAEAGITAQDLHVLGKVLGARRGAVLAVNKWDLVEKDDMTAVYFERDIRERLKPMDFVPIVFISALSGKRVVKVLDMVDEVHEQYNRRIPTSRLNQTFQKAVEQRKPPAREGKWIQLKYITQSETAPPTFVVFANHPKLIEKTYISYLANQLRREYGFAGVPFRLKFRRK